MFVSFPSAVYEILDRPTYHEDFYRNLKEACSLYKIERGQHFQEKGFPSWDAFAAGDWKKALTLAGEGRERYTERVNESKRLGRVQRRLRVVEFPVTPYVQWEMHVLRTGVDVGDEIRVLDASTIADVEKEHAAPEVVILGHTVMYGVRYDEEGNAVGARRYLDPALIRETSAGFETLYELVL